MGIASGLPAGFNADTYDMIAVSYTHLRAHETLTPISRVCACLLYTSDAADDAMNV